MTKLNELQRYIAAKQAALPSDARYDSARLVCVRWMATNIPNTAVSRLHFDAALFAYLPQIKQG